MSGVRHSPPPASGTPWYYTWAIRYCELNMDLPPEDWRPLSRLYEARSPAVCELGRDILGIMHSVGWGYSRAGAARDGRSSGHARGSASATAFW